MRKSRNIFISISISFVMICVTSCKDDPPPPPAKLSFSESEITVNEADDVIEVEVVLDKPVKKDITIEYTLKGTASDKVASPNGYDYEILSDYLEVTIAKGETTGTIEIQLYSDFEIDDGETIQIEMQSVDSDAVELTNDDDIEITIDQEDGLLVILDWDYPSVDMDLFLWAADNTGTLGVTNLYSANIGSTPEYLFMPNIIDDGQYGFSCIYYSGAINPMNFTLLYRTVVNKTITTVATKPGSYSLANINVWDDPNAGTDPVLVATYTKTGNVYSNFSSITTPGSGSRIGSGHLSTTFKKNGRSTLVLPHGEGKLK